MIVDANFNVQVMLTMRQVTSVDVKKVPASAFVSPAFQSGRIPLVAIRHMVIIANVKIVRAMRQGEQLGQYTPAGALMRPTGTDGVVTLITIYHMRILTKVQVMRAMRISQTLVY